MLSSLVSLDDFRAKVYRSRFALVLLILMLAGPSPSNDAARRGQASAPPSRVGLQTFFEPVISFVNHILPRDSVTPASSSIDANSPLSRKVSDFVPLSVEHDPRNSDHQKGHGMLRSRRLSPAIVLAPTILPALVQLHILWLVRFVAGEVEGQCGGRSGKRPRTLPILLVVLTSCMLITVAILPSTGEYLCTVSQRLAPEQAAYRSFTYFPLKSVLFIEALTTLGTLVPLLVLIMPSLFPAKAQIPSPSHTSLSDLFPRWIKAPLSQGEQQRARVAAGLPPRRGGLIRAALVPPTGRPRPEALPEGETSEPLERRSDVADHTNQDIPITGDSSAESATTSPDDSRPRDRRSEEDDRILRLQEQMVQELQDAGRLDTDSTDGFKEAVRQAVLQGKGKPLHQHRQRVTLPLSYVLSLALSAMSSASTISCYTIVAFYLPNLSPTSISALVSLLAIRAELGALVRNWSAERRRIEGLEFVRRRWGSTRSGEGGGSVLLERQHKFGRSRRSGDGNDDDDDDEVSSSTDCSICFEPINWADSDEDAVTLDCGHDLHAPCLVPWLMSHAFCPVCHRPLRRSGKTGRSTDRASRRDRSSGRRGRRGSDESTVRGSMDSARTVRRSTPTATRTTVRGEER